MKNYVAKRHIILERLEVSSPFTPTVPIHLVLKHWLDKRVVYLLNEYFDMAITGNHGACLSVSVTKTANTCAHFIWFTLRNKWKNVCGPQIIDGASQNFEMLVNKRSSVR